MKSESYKKREEELRLKRVENYARRFANAGKKYTADRKRTDAEIKKEG